jgi:ubiquinone/menaquinone biosynthesis C-methylase UbiE
MIVPRKGATMAIDFHAKANRGTYTGRRADAGWVEAIRRIADPTGKRVADIGCGGGIYSLACRGTGAGDVVGIDFSKEMVAAARDQTAGLSHLSFRQGDATATGLPSASVDIVFQRALIHHLRGYEACFAEARRVLVPGGRLIVQDRTPADVELPGSPEHLRGYFFERFPRLLAVETGRRPTDATVRMALRAAGFRDIENVSLWEVRKIHDGVERLKQDLAACTGRSILHDLSDSELGELIAYIEARIPADDPIIEKDRWTLWSAIA